ncbi:MAG TPA: flagellar basal body P-ring formation chaperone FlgA [Tepidisphaeraceae bacterium]|nr:flagellar basal body P-ring formation chaperone FlgA [Tepidisphaeraceae bacterium]
MNGQPTSNRKMIRVLVALMILTWATQTLLHQWARGQEAPPQVVIAAPEPAAERFVPGTDQTAQGATLELRGEATVGGPQVTLRQICRWADADRTIFAPVADLVVARCQGNAPFQSITINEIRRTLRDAGVNLAAVRFAGTTNCTVTRSDVKYDEKSALAQWANAKNGQLPAAAPWDLPTTRPAAQLAAEKLNAATTARARAAQGVAAPRPRTLLDLLLADAALRLALPVEQLQITFNPADEKLLNLAEPQFKFNLEARYVRNLGDVSWDVLIVTEGGTKKVTVNAMARAWQKQVVVSRAMAYRQVIRNDDVIEHRVLADRLPDDPLLAVEQVVGQEAARELKPGTVITARMVSPVPLVKTGQFIAVTLTSGNVRIKTVGRAMEAGSFGQTVRVRNDATHEVYEVVLTGPQEGTMNGGAPPAARKLDSQPRH